MPAVLLGLQLVTAAIPGVEALVTAILGLHKSNPTLTAAQIQELANAITTNITSLDADTVATLAAIPPVPAK